MKKNKKINIPKITFDFTISVDGINNKKETFTQSKQDVKELQKIFALMEGTELDGILILSMNVDNTRLFQVEHKIVKGKIEGVEL